MAHTLAISLLIGGLLLAARLVSTWMHCAETAVGWTLGCAKRWVLLAFALDLMAVGVGYAVLVLPAQLVQAAVLPTAGALPAVGTADGVAVAAHFLAISLFALLTD